MILPIFVSFKSMIAPGRFGLIVNVTLDKPSPVNSAYSPVNTIPFLISEFLSSATETLGLLMINLPVL